MAAAEGLWMPRAATTVSRGALLMGCQVGHQPVEGRAPPALVMTPHHEGWTTVWGCHAGEGGAHWHDDWRMLGQVLPDGGSRGRMTR